MSGSGEDLHGIELVTCPECGDVAALEWQTWISGLLHLKIRCVHRHWFLMLAERITRYGTDPPYLAARAPEIDTPSRQDSDH